MPRFPRFAHAHSSTSFHHYVSEQPAAAATIGRSIFFMRISQKRLKRLTRQLRQKHKKRQTKSARIAQIDKIAFLGNFFSQKVRDTSRVRCFSPAPGFLFPNARMQAESQFFRAVSAESVRTESDTARSSPRACPGLRPS